MESESNRQHRKKGLLRKASDCTKNSLYYGVLCFPLHIVREQSLNESGYSLPVDHDASLIQHSVEEIIDNPGSVV